MGKDFSLTIYRDLIAEITKTGFKVLTFKDYFQQQQDAPAFFIVRHDVDRRPEHALKMALVEYSFGIQSTYYFRVNKRVFKKEIIQKIAELGHEIGYHYEVVDKAHGDMALAGRIFDVELAKLRALTNISTAAMHGNPLTPWDNKDFWQHFSLSQFNLLGEAYISIHNPDLFYVTDTGRGWNRAAFNLKDIFSNSSVSLLPPISTTGQLANLIRKKKYSKMYLQIHPNRWSWWWLQWYRQLGEDLLFNWMKVLLAYYYKKK
ncbi:MAG: hypothetical protein JRJ45_03965 [Deltaproteobacteria bacterium]|nr:hypothetical protein [Deltaproteobacteria bacterium]